MQTSESIKSYAYKLGTGQHKVYCPFCSSQRKKSHLKTLSLKIDDDLIIYNCWHCGEDGAVKIKKNNFRIIERETVSQAVAKNWEDINETKDVLDYLGSRGI